MFKNLKAGDLLQVLEINPISGIPTYYTTPVISSSLDNSATPSYIQEKEMSIVCRLGGDEKDLSKIDPQSTSVKVGIYKIGLDKDWAMAEIRAIHDANKANIAAVDKYQAIIASCAEVLEINGLSPQSDSQRLTSLEGSVAEIKLMLSSLVNELTPSNYEKNDSEQERV